MLATNMSKVEIGTTQDISPFTSAGGEDGGGLIIIQRLPKPFFKGGQTISIRDRGDQNMYFKPNRNVFLTLTKRSDMREI